MKSFWRGFSNIFNLFRNTKEEVSGPEKYSEILPSDRMTDEQWVSYSLLKNGKCPDCGSVEFFEGPSGGICTNILCAVCGSRFNVSMFFAERI